MLRRLLALCAVPVLGAVVGAVIAVVSVSIGPDRSASFGWYAYQPLPRAHAEYLPSSVVDADRWSALREGALVGLVLTTLIVVIVLAVVRLAGRRIVLVAR